MPGVGMGGDRPPSTMANEEMRLTRQENRDGSNHYDDKISIHTKIKRGTGTRDQDTHKIKIRAETPEQAAVDVAAVVEELEKRDVFERVREIENKDND
jgi:hypothetical protein